MLTSGPFLDRYYKDTMKDYSSTYSFFNFVENKYGSGVIYGAIEYMGSGMISNYKCDNLEQSALVRAIHDAEGLDIDNREYKLKNRLKFSTLVEEWQEYLIKHYGPRQRHKVNYPDEIVIACLWYC